MFYILNDEHKVVDYSDKQYRSECQYIEDISELEYRQHPNKVIVVEIPHEKEVPIYDDEGNIIGYETITTYTYELALNPNYEQEETTTLRAILNDENSTKAKIAVENGYVEFKGAKFETNAQTVGDLTATMLLMQASGLESYDWLSKDDQIVELSLEDFGILGGLIAEFKTHIWSEKYLLYKQQIENAQTYEELKQIVIEY